MNVLSLFDGMSCGQQALQRAGFEVTQYFASEIDKHAIKTTMANFPNTVQMGSVVGVDGYSLPKIDLLIGGSPCQSFSFAGKRKGMATKDEQEILTLEHYLRLKGEGFEFEGQSYLFWEYMRLLNECRTKNPNVCFLLENVEMGEKWETVLSRAIGVNGIHINSALISAQNRKRIYWTNIGLAPAGLFGDLESIIQQPKDKGILLKHILQSEVDEKYFLSEKMLDYFKNRKANFNGGKINIREENEKSTAILKSSASIDISDNFIVHNTMPRSSTTGKGGTGPLCRSDGKTYCLDTGTTNAVEIINNATYRHSFPGFNGYEEKSPTIKGSVGSGNDIILNKIRRLTPIECERLQTVADNYTNHVSDSQRYKMLGNGWTVAVIVHILNYLKTHKK